MSINLHLNYCICIDSAFACIDHDHLQGCERQETKCKCKCKFDCICASASLIASFTARWSMGCLRKGLEWSELLFFIVCEVANNTALRFVHKRVVHVCLSCW